MEATCAVGSPGLFVDAAGGDLNELSFPLIEQHDRRRGFRHQDGKFFQKDVEYSTQLQSGCCRQVKFVECDLAFRVTLDIQLCFLLFCNVTNNTDKGKGIHGWVVAHRERRNAQSGAARMLIDQWEFVVANRSAQNNTIENKFRWCDDGCQVLDAISDQQVFRSLE